MSALPVRAKLLIAAEVLGGLAVAVFAAMTWSSSGLAIFSLLFVLASAAGAMKVVLPGIQGNMSASYLFVIWGVVDMSLGETLLLGWGSSLVQAYWHSKKKPLPIQVVFNLCVIAVSIGAASACFNGAWMRRILPVATFRLLIAVLAYFAMNTASVASIIGLTERMSIWKVWRSSYFWTFPHYLLSASLVSAGEYLTSKFGIGITILVLPPAYLVYHMFALHITKLNDALERAKREREHAEEMSSLHLRTIRSLALAIEAKDQTTADHLHRVQTYAMGLAEACGLPATEMEALRAAAILHDVGKIAVPEHIISKPGKLTPEEFGRMKIHTVVGAEIVLNADFPFAVAPLVRAHHEKWDGSGYPDGLKGEEIPLGARILSAVDCLDALVSDRQYRKAMPMEQAMKIIVAEAGKSFDPKVVAALQSRCHELESLAQKTLTKDCKSLSVNAVVHCGVEPGAGYAAASDPACLATATSYQEVLREMSVLTSITSRIGQSDSMERDFKTIETELHALVPFDCLAIYRRHGDSIRCVFAEGVDAALLLGLEMGLGVGASGWTMANRTPLVNGNAASEFSSGSLHKGLSLVSTLSIPLESELGPIGAVTLYSCVRDPFRAEHLRALLAIGSKLTYQMSLDFSGFPRTLPDLKDPERSTVGSELKRLSEGVGRVDSRELDVITARIHWTLP
jgi:putative nucleotidyltransferase with HDIG domain